MDNRYECCASSVWNYVRPIYFSAAMYEFPQLMSKIYRTDPNQKRNDSIVPKLNSKLASFISLIRLQNKIFYIRLTSCTKQRHAIIIILCENAK